MGPSNNDKDPFFKSFQTLKDIITPLSPQQQQQQTAATTRTTPPASGPSQSLLLLQQQAQQRQALDEAIGRAMQDRQATQTALHAAQENRQRVQQDCAVLRQEIQTQASRHVVALRGEREKRQQAVHAQGCAQQGLDQTTAQTASLELHVAEIQETLQQTEQRIIQVQQNHARNQQMQQKTLEALRVDLIEAETQLEKVKDKAALEQRGGSKRMDAREETSRNKRGTIHLVGNGKPRTETAPPVAKEQNQEAWNEQSTIPDAASKLTAVLDEDSFNHSGTTESSRESELPKQTTREITKIIGRDEAVENASLLETVERSTTAQVINNEHSRHMESPARGGKTSSLNTDLVAKGIAERKQPSMADEELQRSVAAKSKSRAKQAPSGSRSSSESTAIKRKSRGTSDSGDTPVSREYPYVRSTLEMIPESQGMPNSEPKLSFTKKDSTQRSTKRQRAVVNWAGHAMNVRQVIVDSHQGLSLLELVEADLSVLKGMDSNALEALREMRLETIRDLGAFKFYRIAKAILVLSRTEGKRLPSTRMNLDNALIKEHETKSLRQVVKLPVSALQGLSAKADRALGVLGIQTIGDFASFRFAAIAEAIVLLAPYEETTISKDRRRGRMLRNLE